MERSNNALKKGKVSVLMGIYNCADTLEQAVYSIIKQTYTNWEIIMCDDGSSDNTYVIAKKLAEQEPRIILIQNIKNAGLNITLNRCLHKADGEYIARMDGDDDCDSKRFEKQVEYLNHHPNVTVVSTGMLFFDENGVWGKAPKRIHEPTAEEVVTGNPIFHAPMMMRHSAMMAVGGYTVSDETLRIEDVDLWIKLYSNGYIANNIDEELYFMRNGKNAFSRRRYRYRINSARIRVKGCKKMKLGFKCYLKALTPMLIGLVPNRVARWIKRQLHK